MLISVLLLLITTLSIYVHKHYLENFKNEINDSINEAKSIHDNLENLLTQAVDVSQSIVHELDNKITQIGDDVEIFSKPIDEPKQINKNISKSSKARVYQLAKEFNVSSKEMVDKLNQLGLNVSNHMNILEEEKANWARDILKTNNEIDSNLDQYNNMSLFAKKINIASDDIFMKQLRTAHPYIAVKTLSEKGYDIKEIAQLLNRGQGEISLIMNLNRTKQAL